MGGVLQAIGEFGQGFGQGAGQGMDLYQRFQNIKDEGSKRRKQEELENAVIDMHKSGKYEKDPIGFANSVADLYLNQGDLDGYQKWNDAATSARDLKTQQLGLQMFTVAQVNPQAAVPLINEIFKTYGNSNSVDLQQSPTGARLVMNINGQTVTKDYAPDQMDELNHQFLQLAEPYAMKPYEAGQLGVARATQEAQQSYNEGRLANDTRQTDSTIATNKAQATSALAQAASAGATADWTRERAQSERETRPLDMASKQADIDYKTKLTETAGVTPAPYDPLGDMIDSSTPAPKAAGDSLDMSSSAIPAPIEDRGFQRQLGQTLKEMGMNDGQAFNTVSEIVRLTPEQTAAKGMIKVDPATGKATVTLPSGQVVAATPAIVSAIKRVGEAAKSAGVE